MQQESGPATLFFLKKEVMKKETIIKARATFQQELALLNNIDYPAMPGVNNGMVVLYAKLLEIEKQLAAITGNKHTPTATATIHHQS